MDALANLECDGATASKLLGIPKQTFDGRAGEGWIKPIREDRYRLGELVRGHKAFLQEERLRTQKTQAASRVQEARAKRIEIRTQRDAGKLIEIEDSVGFLQDTIGALRSALAGAAAAASRNLTVRAEVDATVEAAVVRVRAKFDAAAGAYNADAELQKLEELLRQRSPSNEEHGEGK
jgi:hypothetical protein